MSRQRRPRRTTLRKYRAMQHRYTELYQEGLRTEVIYQRLSQEYHVEERTVVDALAFIAQYDQTEEVHEERTP